MQLSTFDLPTAETESIRACALVFSDPQSQQLLDHVEHIAPSEASVLMVGETGTGKELLARHIHRLSHRADQAFVAVNCGAFSETLIESELFGHEKGAFTGAISAKAGWFEEANGGTVFLDEIGDLPLPLQVKLLRVLQEREVVRLGSRKSIALDVRVIAATNVHLDEAIVAGTFREDLLYRLNVVHLQLLPLRERRGDIVPLAQHFMGVYSRRLRRPRVALDESAKHKLLAHDWRGNIRELENVIHHSLLLVRHGRALGADDVRLAPVSTRASPAAAAQASLAAPKQEAPSGLEPLEQVLLRLLEDGVEHLHERVNAALLHKAYEFCHHNQVHTAQALGMSRNMLRSRLMELGMLAGNRRRGAGMGQQANAATHSALERVNTITRVQ
ncbi:sigma-54-dependent Fis family transcriptional regulator [Lampropedia aestuarii]|uniref:Sigma-54-dependent Fis family transcriptional regulator n=1 Tax=Lampropedia aestuarii TaxID=2562762 RepID=A0A4S5BIB5_9BURK|nr:sigma 54-interacting transcriptional regulator [Lampropedia aestuarii]THJ32147.1 sigma-54-dependent Fis family transcriptional regulator [Lampropedia aestuarii]